ncbi:IclR family transcriptional regulator [Paeniglutamicibacter cryotolerans]|uniref:Glycerol operon regulatory protein n=1 Tax=Paeniglutamicibacter cryotolerans TaxID=670079 RepID=A0A839QKH1_9MICC|nr:IclR family transcriptional regulator [Paeniglutamicibacter cryotolerans]MBB2996103.1 DNA-binding IclR family transcriptional regulator [Paeniglutamicibacter cryotolerans]
MSTSVVRAMRILESLSGASRPMTLTAIADELEIPKSTAHSILKALASRGFLDVDEYQGYTVGLKAFEVGASHLRSTNAVEVVVPQLVELTRALGITSHYAILDGADAVYLCKEDPPGLGLKLASSVGARLPAHTTAVGKAALAWLPEANQEGYLAALGGRRAGKLAVDRLRGELTAVRERGYSSDDGDTALGVRCVAAPVRYRSGPPGSIGVSYLVGSKVEDQKVVDGVVQAARRASELLAHRT